MQSESADEVNVLSLSFLLLSVFTDEHNSGKVLSNSHREAFRPRCERKQISSYTT